MNLKSFLLSLHQAGIQLMLVGDKIKVKSGADKISARLSQQIREHKDGLVALLATGAALAPLAPVVRAAPRQAYPLSFSQQRLWLLTQLEPASGRYNVPMPLRLTGRLDQAALQHALSVLLQRHSVLRTVYRINTSGETEQVILPARPLTLAVTDYRHLTAAQWQRQQLIACEEDAAAPFDLTQDLMLRARLLLHSAQEHVLLLTIHHIACDAWSLDILIREMNQCYQAACGATQASLPTLPLAYHDYALWQQELAQQQVFSQQLQYWRQQLADLPSCQPLTLDKPRPAQLSYQGAVLEQPLSADQCQGLSALARAQGVTGFMLCHALFSVLLSAYSDGQDVVVGTPSANRDQADLSAVVGFFVNTLVLRTSVRPDMSFVQLLQHSRSSVLDAYEAQQLPFEKLVEALQPERLLNQNPLFQLMLMVHSGQQTQLQFADLQFSPVRTEAVQAKFDLTLSVSLSDSGGSLNWEYMTDLFYQQSIQRWSGQFCQLLDAVLARPEISIAGLLAALIPTEATPRLQGGQQVISRYGVHQLFAQQAAASPAALAVQTDSQSLSYQQLNEAANRLAHRLLATGVQPGSLVGICTLRSVGMVIAVLAVMKAGAAYVPLDPHHPAARLAHIIADAGLSLVLCDSAGLIAVPAVATLDLDSDHCSYPANDPELSASPQLIYAIYTSGSTGQPKGVLLSHSGVVNYLQAVNQDYGIDHIHSAVVSSPLAFDATVTSLFAPLVSGRSIRLLADDGQELVQLAALLRQSQQALLFKITPAHLEGLSWLAAGQVLSALPHVVVVGGEQLSSSLMLKLKRDILPGTVFINEYGPTETVVGCCVYRVSSLQQDWSERLAVPIGQALRNTGLHVLDQAGQPVSAGVTGELYISGAGVAMGYINRAELNQSRFGVVPAQPEQRWYRTGDLVRQSCFGDLLFVGRKDQQVKLRGFRIELEEIEHQLCLHPAVEAAVCCVRHEVTGDQLLAYVVGTVQQMVQEAELQTFLMQVLPSYMLPGRILFLDSLPLTANGKVDRNALPAFDPALLQNHYQAPATKTEQTLCEIFSQELKLTSVSATDNFFRLGGSSLSAIRMISQIRLRLRKQISFKEFFRLAQLDQLAQHLDALMPADEPQISAAPELAVYPLSYAQQGVFIEYQLGRGASYNIPAALKFGQDFSLTVFDQALNLLIQQHSSLRTRYTIDEGELVQIVIDRPVEHQTVPVDINSAEISVDAWESAVREDISSRVCEPLDIFSGVMLQSYSYAHPSGEKIVLLNFSHIAVDGWSIGIVVRDLSAFYKMISSGTVAESKAVGLNYVDYAYWQRKSRLVNKKDSYYFWQQKLEPFYSLPPVTTDFDNSARNYGNSTEINYFLNEKVKKGVSELAIGCNCSEFNVWSAIYSVVTAIHNGHENVCINTDFANRTHEGTENIVGMFVNQVVLSSVLDFSKEFDKVLLLLNKDFSDAIYHSDVQFNEILSNLDRVPKNFGEKLMSNKFNYHEFLTDGYSDGDSGINFSEFDICFSALKYDLSLVVSPTRNGVSVTWIYNNVSFKNQTILKLNELLLFIVENVLENKSVQLNDVKTRWNEKIIQDNKNKMSKFKFKKKEIEKDEV
jgi:amino acid adenylation domain-containing protein